MGCNWQHRSVKSSSPVSGSFISGQYLRAYLGTSSHNFNTLASQQVFLYYIQKTSSQQKDLFTWIFLFSFWLLFCLLLLSMCNYAYYTTTIWNHKQNNNNLKLTEVAAFSEVINVWLTCPVAQHQMTTCKAGHNVKLLWIWLFWMGSHFRHWSTNSWPAVTDSFNCGEVYLATDLQMSSENLNSILGSKLELKFTIKLNIWNLRT